jgi:demethylmenaquinone methyltransferase/2-methoxy-6-polyprenyl-1,4-benzoquinol methylase
MASLMSIRASIQTPHAKRDYNAQLFARVAEDYDQATRAMSLGRDRTWKRRLVQVLPQGRGPVCVDLACGTGDVVIELLRRFPDAVVTGVDLTPAMLEVAQRRTKNLPASQVRFLACDMCDTGLPQESVDVVTGSYALRNAPVLNDALREVHRILRPGGYAAFLDFAKSAKRWQQAVQLPLLKWWGGLWGCIIHGGPEHAYIAESLRQFPSRVELRHRFSQRGFMVETAMNCFGGMLEIVLVRKTAEVESQPGSLQPRGR